MGDMPGMPQLGLSLGIDPQSGAAAGGGDYTQNSLGSTFGGFTFGDAAGASRFSLWGLVGDLAVGVAGAIIVKALWPHIRGYLK